MTTMTTDGSATGYRPTRTLTFRTELRRQASRRRTQLTLGFMVVLPLIILIAFEFGDDNGGGSRRSQFAALADLATAGGLNFALFTLLVSASFLLIVVVALFCGDTVASEASWGSLRYLLPIPVPRARLLGSKLTVSLFSCVVALLLLTGTALAAGTLRYGWQPLRTTVAGDVPAGTAMVRLLVILGYLAVSLLVVAGLAVLLQILSSILDQITALGNLRLVLPTHYENAWFGLLSNPVQTDEMVKGVISAVVYATLFFGLAWYRFLKKDVVS